MRSRRAMLFPDPIHRQPLVQRRCLWKKPELLRVCSMAALVNVNSRKPVMVLCRAGTSEPTLRISSATIAWSFFIKEDHQR
jgi:hypothetical protein